MYENQTQEVILERMNLSAAPEVNADEGSMFHIAVSPMSVELAIAYANMDRVLALGFAQTTSLEYLKYRAEEHGVYWKDKTKADGFVVVTGSDGAIIPLGAIFATADGLTYEVTEAKTIAGGSTSAPIVATDFGPIYNTGASTITEIPIDIPGVTGVTNPETVGGGADEETAESLLERLFDHVRKPATSGNKFHYEKWATDVSGVGGAKCFSLWAGPGTVKVAVIDIEKKPASQPIVDDVKEYTESQRPIGATVTYVSATGVAINVSATVSLAQGYLLSIVTAEFEESLEKYFRDEVAFKVNLDETTVPVSHGKVGAILLGTDGVVDYSNLTLNGTTGNIIMAADAVPVKGTVTLSE